MMKDFPDCVVARAQGLVPLQISALGAVSLEGNSDLPPNGHPMLPRHRGVVARKPGAGLVRVEQIVKLQARATHP